MKKLRWKRVLLVLLVLCALGLGALAAGNLWVVRSAAPWIRTPEDAAGLEADCVLVLGAGLWAPGQPSPMLADRIRRGLELWELGAGQTLLMSGEDILPAGGEALSGTVSVPAMGILLVRR